MSQPLLFQAPGELSALRLYVLRAAYLVMAVGLALMVGPLLIDPPGAHHHTGLVARTAGPARPMLNAMRQAVAAEAPQAPILHVRTLAQREEEGRRAVLRASGANSERGSSEAIAARSPDHRGS